MSLSIHTQTQRRLIGGRSNMGGPRVQTSHLFPCLLFPVRDVLNAAGLGFVQKLNQPDQVSASGPVSR